MSEYVNEIWAPVQGNTKATLTSVGLQCELKAQMLRCPILGYQNVTPSGYETEITESVDV